MHFKMLTLRDDFPHSPFSPFADMESEIAELKTMTRVTKLRQQIECREEGSWMVVRDIHDGKNIRKVTSYGRASRSMTRSVTGDLNLNSFINKPEVIIEYPEEKSKKQSSVEIEEIIEPNEPIEPINESIEPTHKKTSIVTLGKGNLVLIDDEDSNFKVTGISKGKVADAVNTLERITDKKVKKVGFSKTEVHFAPDSGRVNIVETDDKPPPSQVRRKKKLKKKSNLPKLYFGDDLKITEHVFPVIREPSPLLSTTLTQKESEIPLKFKEIKESYIGNVSPKLNKLIQNSLQHEFILKQQKIMKKDNQPTTIKLGDDESKSITHIINEEPLYVNKEIKGEEKKIIKRIEDKAPKPKPRTSITKINLTPKEPIKPLRNNKTPDKLPRRTCIKKEATPIKTIKPTRSITPKNEVKKNKIEITSSHKLQKLIKNTTDKNAERLKKQKEPLRSFEKVSNGWVGHCIVPIKTKEVTSNTSSQTTGVKRTTETKSRTKVTLANKQFSLSKEHLKSAKLVKEISKEKENNIESKTKIIENKPPHTIDTKNKVTMDEMTASYSEICEGPEDDLDRCEELPPERPRILELKEKSSILRQEEYLKQLDGTVTREGDMITFIAGNLEEKIKLSSPTSDYYWNEGEPGETKLLEELEAEASILAASVDSLTETLAETLHGISALTVDCLESYRDVVCKACDSVDTNIKSMYQLMAKCEEMSKTMAPIYTLNSHIKNIKHLLDVYEAIPR